MGGVKGEVGEGENDKKVVNYGEQLGVVMEPGGLDGEEKEGMAGLDGVVNYPQTKRSKGKKKIDKRLGRAEAMTEKL